MDKSLLLSSFVLRLLADESVESLSHESGFSPDTLLCAKKRFIQAGSDAIDTTGPERPLASIISLPMNLLDFHTLPPSVRDVMTPILMNQCQIGVIVFAVIDKYQAYPLLVNQALCDMSGFSLAEFSEIDLMAQLVSADTVNDERAIQGFLNGWLDHIELDKSFYRKDGSIIDVLLNVMACSSAEKSERIGVAMVSDITATNRQQLAQHGAERLKIQSDITAGIAHDLNNLLSVLLHSLELIDTTKKELSEQSIQRCLTVCHRGIKLVDQFVSQSNSASLQSEKIDNVGDLISDMLSLASDSIGKNVNIILTSTVSESYSIYTSKNQVIDSVLNLLINARDAIQGEGSIEIKISRESSLHNNGMEYLRIDVIDQGVGIDASVLTRIYEPYYSTKPHGNGLGLSMVKSTMESAGGEVDVTSVLGDGSCFSLKYPIVNSFSCQVKSDENFVASFNKEQTVLIVEDLVDLHDIMVDIFGLLGFKTYSAKNRAEAERAIQAIQRIDLLITDVYLPDSTDVWSLVSIAMSRHDELRVIVNSAHHLPEDEQGWLENDRLIFLRKPFPLVDLKDAITQLFEAQ